MWNSCRCWAYWWSSTWLSSGRYCGARINFSSAGTLSKETNENHHIKYQIWFKSFTETHSPCMAFFNAVRRRFWEKTIFTKINSLIAGFISLWKFMTLIKINARAFSLVHKVARLRYSSQLYIYMWMYISPSIFLLLLFCKI